MILLLYKMTASFSYKNPWEPTNLHLNLQKNFSER